MIKKTRNYDQFIFRNDNRDKIDENHVQKICDSVESRNLLELRPILVNSKMEIIDGQHRLLAAKKLGVDIYYEVQSHFNPLNIIALNVNKSWNIKDYFNFYCNNNYEDYVKLKEFIDKHEISLLVSLTIFCGNSNKTYNDFKKGEFKFTEDDISEELSICQNTISYIKKFNGFSQYTSSNRFWKALMKLVSHANFDEKKWMMNLKMMIDHLTVKATSSDYLKTLQHIYNYRNNIKISLIEEEL